MICGQPELSHQYRAAQPNNYLGNMCFEVLGFDIYIDDQLKPYVLEVNHTPSFATDSALDALIKKNVIKDALVLLNLSVKNKRDEINERRELMY